jgi:hypothetical protein
VSDDDVAAAVSAIDDEGTVDVNVIDDGEYHRMPVTLRSGLIMPTDAEVEMLCDDGISKMRYYLIDVTDAVKRKTMSLKR